MHSPVQYNIRVELTRVTAALAHTLRAARAERGWSLDELAARAGVSRRLLVQIEQGQTNPTIASLLAVSDALGLGLPRLLEVPDDPALQVMPAGRAPTVWHGSGGGHAELLAGTPPPDIVEVWDWRLGPGDRYGNGPHSPGTREVLHVLSGAVRVEVGDESAVLTAGDTASFAGTRPHSYSWATADGAVALPPASDGSDGMMARFTLVVLQPAVGPLSSSSLSESVLGGGTRPPRSGP